MGRNTKYKSCDPEEQLWWSDSAYEHDNENGDKYRYDLDSMVCLPFEGSCEHGELIEQKLREKPGHCGTCDAGYHLTEDHKCAPNKCTCRDGVATTSSGVNGTLCSTDGAEDCSSCDTGYTLNRVATKTSNSKCVATRCFCHNGYPTFSYDREDQQDEGMLCAKGSEGEDCYACHQGYALNESRVLEARRAKLPNVTTQTRKK